MTRFVALWNGDFYMKWNRKYIVICSAFFFILAAFLIGKGWQMPKEENMTRKGIEENIIQPSVTGSFIQENKTGEAVPDHDTKTEEIKSKKQEKNISEKSRKQGKNSEQEQTKTNQKNTDKKQSGQTKKKNTEKAEEHNTATAKPTVTPDLSQEETGKEEKKQNPLQVSFQIDCINILSQRELWKEGIEEIIPSNGIFYKGVVSFTEGETVYDLLKKICKENGIPLDSQYTPLYGTYYIKGIGNLYEFDCGGESGWKYAVKEIIPGVGASNYKVRTEDNIRFFYDYQY